MRSRSALVKFTLGPGRTCIGSSVFEANLISEGNIPGVGVGVGVGAGRARAREAPVAGEGAGVAWGEGEGEGAAGRCRARRSADGRHRSGWMTRMKSA
jgi:hypothetical protein